MCLINILIFPSCFPKCSLIFIYFRYSCVISLLKWVIISYNKTYPLSLCNHTLKNTTSNSYSWKHIWFVFLRTQNMVCILKNIVVGEYSIQGIYVVFSSLLECPLHVQRLIMFDLSHVVFFFFQDRLFSWPLLPFLQKKQLRLAWNQGVRTIRDVSRFLLDKTKAMNK